MLARVEIDRFFFRREQIKQQSRESGFVERARHKLISRTVPAAPAAMCEKNQRLHDLLAAVTEINPESVQARFVKQFFITAAQSRSDIFALGNRAPIGRRRHAAMMRRETDQYGFAPKMFPNQLTDVELTMLAHLGRARVSEMRIVRPNDRFRLSTPVQVRH